MGALTPLSITLLPFHAGDNDPSELTPLALPTNLGGHQGHIAAALASSKQHLEQQKKLNAALQVDISTIGTPDCPLLPFHIMQQICMLLYRDHLPPDKSNNKNYRFAN